MKKIFLLFLVLLILFFVNEYISTAFVFPKEKPSQEMVKGLYKILECLPYGEKDYKADVFDCSNTSALLFDFLKTKGFQPVIVVGTKLSLEWPFFNFHSWLVVYKDGKKFLIEPNPVFVFLPDINKSYILRIRFRSLKILRFFSKLIFLPDEFIYNIESA